MESFGQFAKAQVVYTDVNPDTTIKSGSTYDITKTYGLDLNNDGTVDFNINELNGAYYTTYFYVRVTPLNTNEVLDSLKNSVYYPVALGLNSYVGANLVWRNDSNQILRYEFSGNYSSGFWSENTDAYLGLKVIVGSDTSYGWVRLSIKMNYSTITFTIKDYAYNSMPNKPILAGQTCPPQASVVATGSTTFCAGDSVILSSANTGTNLSYKWKLNGNSISGATNKSYTAKTAGKYKVKVTDNTNGCSLLSDKLKVTVPCKMNDAELANEIGGLKIYPNPFSQSTSISFSLSQSQNVSLKIYDVTGRLIKILADGMFEAGENKIEWNATDENAGIYFLRMEAEDYLHTEKISVIK